MLLACLLTFNSACASDNSVDSPTSAVPAKVSYKFTTTYLGASDDNNAVDVNLRANYDVHTTWIGEYGDRDGFR